MAENADQLGREQLAELVDGRTDEEINEFVSTTGVDTVLDQIFEGMQEAFLPEKAAGQSALVQWDIAAPDGTRSYQFKVDNGECSVAKGAGDAPRVTLGLALADFVRFVSGKLDGMQAFMSGKLKLTGDMFFAQTMQAWFAQ
jgi:putative sterol carrier protein